MRAKRMTTPWPLGLLLASLVSRAASAQSITDAERAAARASCRAIVETAPRDECERAIVAIERDDLAMLRVRALRVGRRTMHGRAIARWFAARGGLRAALGFNARAPRDEPRARVFNESASVTRTVRIVKQLDACGARWALVLRETGRFQWNVVAVERFEFACAAQAAAMYDRNLDARHVHHRLLRA
jgi:hypothetical protein